MEKIQVKSVIHQPVSKVWETYTEPLHIVNWNFATPEWHCPEAKNNLKVGGEYFARMEAKDGSFGFDFKAIYKDVIPEKKLVYVLEDNREVSVEFKSENNQTIVDIIFDAETQNPIEMQKAGWQMILDNFKQYTESCK